jgi:hypothetical protein
VTASARARAHLRANAVGYFACFLALSGTAAALPGTNTVDSGDIANTQVKTRDLAPGAVERSRIATSAVSGAKVLDDAVTGADVDESTVAAGGDVAGPLTGLELAADTVGTGEVDGSLTGADVVESSLVGVNAATLQGRTASDLEIDGLRDSAFTCNPASSTPITCAATGTVSVGNLTPVLVVATGTWRGQGQGLSDSGTCAARRDDAINLFPEVELGQEGDEHADVFSNSSLALATIDTVSAGQHSWQLQCRQNGGDIVFSDLVLSAVPLTGASIPPP